MSDPENDPSAPTRRAGRLRRIAGSSSLRRMGLSIALLTERRIGLLLTVDGLFFFFGFLGALEGTGSAKEFYPLLFLVPALVLGVPVLADAVVVERRSGTLDLALSSAGSAIYFQRRIGSFALLMVAQGWLGIFMARATIQAFPLAPPMIQIVVVTLFLAAAALNWSLRLRTMGAVVVMTIATCLAVAPWFFTNPIHPYAEFGRSMNLEEIAAFCRANLVMSGAAGVLYLYAVKRLMNPELILSNGA
jgi:hypothetical protein